MLCMRRVGWRVDLVQHARKQRLAKPPIVHSAKLRHAAGRRSQKAIRSFNRRAGTEIDGEPVHALCYCLAPSIGAELGPAFGGHSQS